MTLQQIEQMRINSCRQGLTMFGEYAAGAMDASEWQRKHDIEKACDLVYEQIVALIGYTESAKDIAYKDFCKAMEEQLC